MKTLFAIIAAPLLAITIASCNQRGEKAELKNKNLLSTNMVNNPNTATGVDTAVLGAQPIMTFVDTIHNFGNMKDGEIGVHDFEFTNTGKSPLIINNASGSCGCTVPEYPHEPIAPGKTGLLKVKFHSADKLGHQEKSVIVTTNSSRGTHMLYIKADVKK